MYQINDLKKSYKIGSSKSILIEVKSYLPQDLMTKVTVLMQKSGYITVKPQRLTRSEWSRFNKKVKQIGGFWVSNDRFSHWSIPY
ncbi:hypothetical protein JW865_08465 [Candidatus Bathyarchaeota archaeon]|nr:hypothetical protein [Candidatus Bathyarchaeota archaeon]